MSLAEHYGPKKPKPKNWISGAIKKPGAFTASAKKAGKGVQEFAHEKASAGGTLGRRARLALTLAKMRK